MKKNIKKSIFLAFFLAHVVTIQAQSDATYTGNITVSTQAQVDALRTTLVGKTIIAGNLTIGASSNITDLSPLRNITEVTGRLTIQENDSLTNLEAFTNLQTIGGVFQMTRNGRMRTMGNLPSLQTIGGNFFVSRSTILQAVGDFPALTSIGGIFNVIGNNSLRSLGNFSALTSIKGDWILRLNTGLRSLGDFSSLSIIEGNFLVLHSSLTNLRELTSLQTIGGDFEANNKLFGGQKSSTSLRTIDLISLQTIGGYLSVEDNADLTTLGELTSLQTIGGYLRVRNNENITSLGTFPNLTRIGTESGLSINIESNSNLSFCSVVRKFLAGGDNAVSGTVNIRNNNDGCNSVREVNSDVLSVSEKRIFIPINRTSTSFDVFSNIRWKLSKSDDADWIDSLSVGDNSHPSFITGENISTITIRHSAFTERTTSRSTTFILTAVDENDNELTNPASVTIHLTQSNIFTTSSFTKTLNLLNQENLTSGLPSSAVIQGNVIIGSDNLTSAAGGSITNLAPLNHITHITGNLILRQNGSLTNLDALNNLQYVGGNLVITENGMLTSISGFNSLVSVGGDFILNAHNVLETVNAFKCLQTIGGAFIVRKNRDLHTIGGFYSLTHVGTTDNVASSKYIFSDINGGKTVSIQLSENEDLSSCCALANFFSEENNGSGRRVFVRSNAEGCNTGDMIRDECHTLILNTEKIYRIAYDNNDSIIIRLTSGGDAMGWNSEITSTPENADFIMLNPEMQVSQTGNFSIIARPTTNTGREQRTNTITLTTTGDEGTSATRIVIITQKGRPNQVPLSVYDLPKRVEIFPVVVEDAFTLTIDHPFKGEVQLRLYTLNGAIIKTERYYKTHSLLSKSIEVSHLSGGIYLVNIYFDTFTLTRKLVKK